MYRIEILKLECDRLFVQPLEISRLCGDKILPNSNRYHLMPVVGVLQIEFHHSTSAKQYMLERDAHTKWYSCRANTN